MACNPPCCISASHNKTVDEQSPTNSLFKSSRIERNHSERTNTYPIQWGGKLGGNHPPLHPPKTGNALVGVASVHEWR